jgi:DNA-binding CsgD family transcriptional regulator
MLTNNLKQLRALKAKAAALEKEVSAVRNKRLAALPGEFGFGSADEFLQAFRAAVSSRGKGRAQASKPARRRRATITDDTRAEVKKLVAAGKTGAEIAKATGISLPSVQNIKKALGLVTQRKA